MGAEDFGLYLDHVPGTFAFLGARPSHQEPFPLHHAQFDFDERALPLGVETLVTVALEYLNGSPKFQRNSRIPSRGRTRRRCRSYRRHEKPRKTVAPASVPAPRPTLGQKFGKASSDSHSHSASIGLRCALSAIRRPISAGDKR